MAISDIYGLERPIVPPGLPGGLISGANGEFLTRAPTRAPVLYGAPSVAPPVMYPAAPVAPPSMYPVAPVPPPVAPVVPPVAPVVPAGTASPLNTLYGVDSESFLTDDQRKMSRMIQNQFDASTNRRDRELSRYGAPRLSSFSQDEAMARAIAMAQGLNYKEPVAPLPGGRDRGDRSGRGDGDGGGRGRGGVRDNRDDGYGGNPRYPRDPNTPRPNSPSTAARWQQIATGLMSAAPLLFGKAGWASIMDKGLFTSIKDAIFGPGANVSPAQLEAVVRDFGGSTDTYLSSNGGDQYYTEGGDWTPTGDSGILNADGWGGGDWGGGGDWWEGGDWGATDSGDWWEGGDWGGGGDWWDFAGGSGGEYVDLFGGV